MFANTQLGGQDAAFPDVCKTPSNTGTITITYPNTASGMMGSPAVYAVLFGGGPAHNTGTTVSQTNGDNAGVVGGTSSSTVMSSSRHTLGTNTFLVGGMPASRLTSMTQQNSTNATGARLSPSQVKVLVLAS